MDPESDTHPKNDWSFNHILTNREPTVTHYDRLKCYYELEHT